VVDHEAFGPADEPRNGHRRRLGYLLAVVVRMLMQQQGQQVFVQCGACSRRQGQAGFIAGAQIRQGAPPDPLEVFREGPQRKSERLLQGMAKPTRALALELADIEADRFLYECPVEPQLGIEASGERHGLALAPLCRSMLLGGESSPLCTTHHEKQAGKVLGVDLYRRAVG
jgi:hypothetical protein